MLDLRHEEGRELANEEGSRLKQWYEQSQGVVKWQGELKRTVSTSVFSVEVRWGDADRARVRRAWWVHQEPCGPGAIRAMGRFWQMNDVVYQCWKKTAVMAEYRVKWTEITRKLGVRSE